MQGARSVRKSGVKAIFVFIAPPSLEDLANRLAGRGTETVEQITRRLNNAKAEIERYVQKHVLLCHQVLCVRCALCALPSVGIT